MKLTLAVLVLGVDVASCLALGVATGALARSRATHARMAAGWAEQELSGTWDRTGKGKSRWKPGDETGDASVDYRLLWSSWTLSPPILYVSDACRDCTTAPSALGAVGFPCRISHAEGSERQLPSLEGAGVPALASSLEICSFAAGVAKEGKIAPATGRADVAEWLARAGGGGERAALLADLSAMMRGCGETGAPCLNAWGFSMDDALVLPVLRDLAAGDLSDCPADVAAYLRSVEAFPTFRSD